MDNSIEKVLPIENLGLSVRAYNCLKRNRIHDTADLLALSKDDLSNMRNMGRKSVEEVVEVMQKLFAGEFKEVNLLKKDVNIPKKIMVLHHVSEDTLINEVSGILFQNQDGLYVEDVSIEELQFSKRTMGILLRSQCITTSQIINMKYSDLCELSGMGAKSLAEIIDKLSEITLIRYAKDGSDEKIEVILEQLSEEFSVCLDSKIKLQLLANIKTTLLKMSVDESSNFDTEVLKNTSFLHVLYSDTTTEKLMQTAIMSLMKNGAVTHSFVVNNMPQTFVTSGRFDEMLREMLCLKKIEETEDGYEIYYPCVGECIEQLENKKSAQALYLRLEGKTLEETGNELGVTRERARQMIKKALEHLPKVKENQFKYWFENYALNKDDFNAIFKTSNSSYNYMSLVFENIGKKTLEDILEDERATGGIIRRTQAVMKKYSVLIGEEYVPLKRGEITKSLLKLHFSDREYTVAEFYDFYNSFLVEKGLDHNEQLVYASERALEARISDSHCVLVKYGRRFRYYNIQEYDVEQLFNELGLDNYIGLEISTLKLFLSNPDLMSEYNIQDEYELHNLMKKCEDMLPDIGITLGRMPFIAIGNADRAKQVEEFLFRVAPIEIYQFGAAYEEEYGIKAETVLANFVQYIDKYYHNLMFTVNQKEMSSIEYAELQNLLVEDFYFIDDIKKKYQAAFPDGDSTKVNVHNLKVLGFLVYIDYVIKKNHQNADKYFRMLLLSKDEIDLKDIDKRLHYNQTFNKALDDLRTEYLLLEVEPNKYISFDKFAKNAPGISKEDLMEYSIAVPQSTEEKYFTIKSIRDTGLTTKIDNLGYSDWFYGALLRSNKSIRYSKVAGGFLFSHDSKQITRGDFFCYIVRQFEQIGIIDFMRYLEGKYGLKYERSDITAIVSNTSMYYSPVTETIYSSKELYYSRGTVSSNLIRRNTDIETPLCDDIILENANEELVDNRKEQRTSFDKSTNPQEETIINFDTKRLEEILNKFNRGFRKGSSLENKKFRRYYEETYGEELALTEFQLETLLARIGVVYENRIYSSENIVDSEVANKINEYIKGMFDSGKNIVYYASIYQEFGIEFQQQQVYSVDMLKSYLEHIYKDKYYMKRTFMAEEPNAEANPTDELKQCLLSNQRSMSFEEMAQELPHIPIERIKSVLATNSVFIRDARGSYFSAEIVQFNDDELRQMELLIRTSIETNGFMAGNKLLQMIEVKYPDIYEKLLAFQDMGKRDCVAFWLKDRFCFNGNIISEHGKSYKMQDIFALYCQKHAYITMDMLNALKTELDTTIYFDAVYDNTLRISEDEFVSKEQACFNVFDTDRAIDKFCQGDYVALSEIQQFALFPDAGFQWNTYLLEHYVYAYSDEFTLLHTATFNAKASGIIVRKSSHLKTFDDVVVDALAYSGVELNVESALIYLYEHDYIARKKVSSIEQIIEQAKRLRDKR